MHNTFLHNVARELLALPDFNPGECKIIFPNKRPEYYFRKAIRDIAGKEMDFAEISSIEDFTKIKTGP